MKLIVRHLGKIKNATLDIRPLTLIIGENNTNKSWTAYSAYMLLRALSNEHDSQSYTRIPTEEFNQQIKKMAGKTARQIKRAPKSASLNLGFSREEIIKHIDSAVHIFIGEQEIAQAIAAPEKLLKGASAELIVPKHELNHGSKFFFLNIGRDGSLNYGDAAKRPRGDLSFPEAMDKLFSSYGARSITFDFLNREEDWEGRVSSFLRGFALRSFDNAVILPAERKALVTLYRHINLEAIGRLPIPFRYFIQILRSAETMFTDMGEKGLRSKPSPISKLYSKLERIIGGHVTFEKSSLGERLVFSPTKNVLLPIQAASSLVRSLAGFTLAIGRFSTERNILVVDEPEMNAHPSAQLAIAEFLAALARLGNYVIATTHSPYVVDHLNNLLAAGALRGNARVQAAKMFTLKMDESFLTPDMISAYEISPRGIVSNLMDDQRGRISTATFGNVSNMLENLYGELIELGEK